MTRGLGGTYRVGTVWYYHYSVDGKQYRRSSGSTRKGDARAQLQEKLAEIQSGRFIGPDAARLRFPVLAEMLRDHYRTRRSKDRAERALAHLTRHLEYRRIRALTLDVLTAYRNARFDEGAAPATVKYELAVLGKGLTLAVRAGKLAQRPPMPEVHVENARAGFFESDECAALLRELPDVLRGAIEFAYLTGWRVPSEVLPLEWNQVDLEAGIVRLEPGRTKNGRGRTFPLSALPPLRAVLERQRAYTDAVQRRLGRVVPLVFHREGKRIRSFRTAWKGATERAGLTGRIPHDFRRTAVRNLERAGVPRSVAMQLVGHETESIYRRYAIVTERDLAEGVEKLARLLDAPQAARHASLEQRRQANE